jgi:hypothetical protein
VWRDKRKAELGESLAESEDGKGDENRSVCLAYFSKLVEPNI